jgi:hypothetical protein
VEEVHRRACRAAWARRKSDHEGPDVRGAGRRR